jgi:nucleolar complex protein 2
MQELSKLAEKDPEFYKYLQENDAELLNFDPDTMAIDSDEEEADTKGAKDGKAPVLTSRILREWQKALLEVCRLQYLLI